MHQGGFVTQAGYEQMANRRASGMHDLSVPGGNGAWGGRGAGGGAGGTGGTGWLNPDKDITLVETKNGRTGFGLANIIPGSFGESFVPDNAKIVIRLAT